MRLILNFHPLAQFFLFFLFFIVFFCFILFFFNEVRRVLGLFRQPSVLHSRRQAVRTTHSNAGTAADASRSRAVRGVTSIPVEAAPFKRLRCCNFSANRV